MNNQENVPPLVPLPPPPPLARQLTQEFGREVIFSNEPPAEYDYHDDIIFNNGPETIEDLVRPLSPVRYDPFLIDYNNIDDSVFSDSEDEYEQEDVPDSEEDEEELITPSTQ